MHLVEFRLTSRVVLTDYHKRTIEAAAKHAAVKAANDIEEQIAMEILGLEEGKETDNEC